jgi:hypothetical protein
MDNTKIMSNAHAIPTPITTGHFTLEVLDDYMYTQTVQLGRYFEKEAMQSSNPTRLGSVRDATAHIFVQYSAVSLDECL